MRTADFTVPLALLAEQADRVLEEVSWPARRDIAAEAPECDTVTATSPEMSDVGVERLAFGVTLAQIDALDRLVAMISVHGDVMAASADVELADHTVFVLGQAIHDGAKAVRDILDQVEAQHLGHMARRPTGVGEERAPYGTGLARLVSAPALPAAAQPSSDNAEPLRSVRLH